MPRIAIVLVLALGLTTSTVSAGGASSAVVGWSCVGLSAPFASDITDPFGPIGRYEGHWGIDFADSEGLDVRAAASGVVSFSGVVVGNRTVTVDHGGGLKTSYSYLESARVVRGDWVVRGELIGSGQEGVPHDALHFSTRISGSYVDPEPLIGCLLSSPSTALRLTEPPP